MVVFIIIALAILAIILFAVNKKQPTQCQSAAMQEKPSQKLQDIGLRYFGDEPNLDKLFKLYEEKKYSDLKMESFEMVRKAWEDKNSTHPTRSDNVNDAMMFAYQFNTTAAKLMEYRDLMEGDVSELIVQITPAQVGACEKDGKCYPFIEFYNNMATELHNVYFPCEGCPMIDNCTIIIRP